MAFRVVARGVTDEKHGSCQAMEEVIGHSGVVQSIEGQHVRVKIVQASACSACRAKSLCASAESQEKMVDVWTRESDRYSVGQEVRVNGTLSMGRRAVTVAFTLPLVLMVGWLVLSLKVLGMGELAAVGGVCAVLVVYYVVLSLLQGRLSRHFSFWIEPTQFLNK